MFKRKHDLSALFHLKAAFWPENGWKRRAKYYKHRIIREAGSASGVAKGLACGVCVSFTPFLGLHILIAAGAARLMKANMLAAAIGTVVGNPFTFPVMFYLSYQVGQVLLSPFIPVQTDMITDQANMLSHLGDFLGPMALGGTVLAFGLFPFAFALCYPLGRAARALNLKRKEFLRKKAEKKRGLHP